MTSFFVLPGLVALAFASTNLDNLLLLVGLQATGKANRRTLLAGYLLGMAGVLGLSIIIGLVGYLFPLEYLGYLGVVPILVGLKMLLQGQGEASAEGPTTIAVGTIAVTQLSNGVDTVLVFAPLLADSQFVFDVQIAVLFVVMVFVWFFLGRLVGRHASRLHYIDVLGRWLAPLIMIGVGLYILSNTATDLSVG